MSVWILTVAMVCVFINELVVNSRAQGTPVSFKVCKIGRPMNVECFPIRPKAHSKPHVGPFVKCANQYGSPFSRLHEAS